MIGRLTGSVVHESPDGVIVLDVHGVGYELVAPLGTIGRASRHADGTVTLQVHTHVREDAIVLFGFSDERERSAFRTLTSVAGIGPKIAVGILGALPANELAMVVTRGDTRRLQGVPGVGKKLAERMALELKDKLGAVLDATDGTPAAAIVAAVPSGSGARGESPTIARLVDTLVRMGFRPGEAEHAAAELRDRSDEPFDVLVRDALRALTP